MTLHDLRNWNLNDHHDASLIYIRYRDALEDHDILLAMTLCFGDSSVDSLVEVPCRRPTILS